MARESQNDQFEPGTPVGVKGILRGDPLNKRISPRVRSPLLLSSPISGSSFLLRLKRLTTAYGLSELVNYWFLAAQIYEKSPTGRNPLLILRMLFEELRPFFR